MTLFPSSCLIALDNTSSTTLNMKGEYGHLYILDFSGNAVRLSLFNVKLIVCLLKIALIMMSYVPYIPVCYHEEMLEFFQKNF